MRSRVVWVKGTTRDLEPNLQGLIEGRLRGAQHRRHSSGDSLMDSGLLESKYFPPDFGGATELHVWDVSINGEPVELSLRGSEKTWSYIVNAPSAKWSASSGPFRVASRREGLNVLMSYLALHFNLRLRLVCSSEAYVIEEHEI